MTEEEWLTGTDPTPMQRFVRDRASERNLRLFSVACCRSIWGELRYEKSRHAVEIAEKFADNIATEAELHSAAQVSSTFVYAVSSRVPEGFHAAAAADYSVSLERDHNGYLSLFIMTARHALTASLDYPAEWQTQCSLLRDIFGNPFRPVVADPAWLTATAVSIATAIYEDRTFDRLPILADALEEAGCTDADVLLHCRQPGEHVRGCWVVDLVLGKE